MAVDGVEDEDEAEVVWPGGVFEHLGQLDRQLGDGFTSCWRMAPLK